MFLTNKALNLHLYHSPKGTLLLRRLHTQTCGGPFFLATSETLEEVAKVAQLNPLTPSHYSPSQNVYISVLVLHIFYYIPRLKSTSTIDRVKTLRHPPPSICEASGVGTTLTIRQSDM